MRDIIKSNRESKILRANADLNSLMSLNGIDLILLTRLFSSNHFQNLPSMQFNGTTYSNISACVNTTINEFNEYLAKHPANDLSSQMPYIKSSPCFNLEAYPLCTYFCDWHTALFKTISKEEFLMLMK